MSKYYKNLPGKIYSQSEWDDHAHLMPETRKEFGSYGMMNEETKGNQMTKEYKVERHMIVGGDDDIQITEHSSWDDINQANKIALAENKKLKEHSLASFKSGRIKYVVTEGFDDAKATSIGGDRQKKLIKTANKPDVDLERETQKKIKYRSPSSHDIKPIKESSSWSRRGFGDFRIKQSDPGYHSADPPGFHDPSMPGHERRKNPTGPIHVDPARKLKKRIPGVGDDSPVN